MTDQFDRERNILIELNAYASILCGYVAGGYALFVPSAKLDYFRTAGKGFLLSSAVIIGVGIPVIVGRAAIRGIRNRRQRTFER